MKKLILGLLLILSCVPAGRSQSNFTGNAQIYSGQQAVTGTATALANQPLKTFCIKALHANTSIVYIGPSGVTSGTGMELTADQSWCANIDNANRVFIIGTSGANVSWIGTN